MRRLPILLACLLVTAVVASCGDDEEQPASAAPEPTATETAAPAPAAGVVDAGAISKDVEAKPEVAKPSGDPPAELQKADVVKGKGKAAQAGDRVSMQYVGNAWSTGAQFDASWDRGSEPFTFRLGAGKVIAGWDQGIVGMKQGGRRLLVIPPDLAYGAQSPGPGIGPNETLIFVVDLTKIG